MRNQVRPVLRLLTVLVGAALVGSVVAAMPANASPAGPVKPPAPAKAAATGNCVVELARGSSKAVSTSCFGTFQQAISFATGGRVADAPMTAAEAVTKSDLAAKVNAGRIAANPAAAQQMIGIEYEAANYAVGAWSLVFFGSQCTFPVSDVDFEYSLPQAYWDQISSFQTYSVCLADHYYLQDFGLPRTGYLAGQSPMPLMNVDGGPNNGDNNARSIRWS